MRPLLQLEQLVKRYGGLLATDHVSLALAPGELHAVIGPNGAGKTTLIGQLAGEIRPDSGRTLFDGRDITGLPTAQRALLGLARSFQITSVFPEFTVLENVALAMQAHCGHSFRFWTPVLSQAELVEPAHSAIAQAGLAEGPVALLADPEGGRLPVLDHRNTKPPGHRHRGIGAAAVEHEAFVAPGQRSQGPRQVLLLVEGEHHAGDGGGHRGREAVTMGSRQAVASVRRNQGHCQRVTELHNG